MTAFTFPIGEYYVGDPSAVLPCQVWGEICRQTRDFTTGGPLFECQGHPLFIIPVRCGDGIYADDAEGVYVIGSGLIGVIPRAISDADPLGPNAAAGRWEDVLQQLTVTVYENMITVNVDGGHEFSIDLEEQGESDHA